MDEQPDLEGAQIVSVAPDSAPSNDVPDLSTAVPIQDDVAQRARDTLNKVSAGELDLAPAQIQQLITSAREGKGPWQRASEWTGRLLDPLINPVTGAKMLYSGVTGLAKQGLGAIKEQAQIEKESPYPFQAETEMTKRLGAGALRGIAGLATTAAGAASEIGELTGLDTPENAAGLYQFQHDIHKAINQTTGVSPESELSKTGELLPLAALPIGAEAKLAPTIAKAADVAVETAPKVIGKTISGTAKAGQVVGPAIAAGELTATGHPIMALGTLLAGYTPARYGWIGSIKHAIIDQGLGAIKTFGQAMADKPYGVPILKGVQNDLRVEATKLETKLADMRASAGEAKLSRVDKLGPDGTPLYDLEELSPVEKEIRLNQGRLKNAREGIDKIEPYAQANRVLTDAAKYGLQTVGNLGVAETAGAAFTSAGAPPGDVEAQRAGQEMGLAFGLPGLHRANVSGRLEMLRNEMIGKGKKLISEDQLVGLTPEQRDSIYAHAAEVAPLGGKIEILSPEEMIQKQSGGTMPPEEGSVAVNGFLQNKPNLPDYNTMFINRDAIKSGVIGHEFEHLADNQLDLSREKFSQDIQGRIDTGTEAYKNFAQKYLEAKRRAFPDAPELTPKQVNEEVKAEIGRLIKLHMPPETFYGGKGGATIIKDWVSKLFNKDNGQIIGTVDGFGAPYTRGDINALKDVFYDIGEKARSGEKVSPSVRTAEPQEKRATEPSSASTVPSSMVSDATSALKGLGVTDPGPKVEAAIQELGPDATLEDVVRKATQRAVPKDLSDISLMPQSDTIDRPASKISDLIFPGTPRQAKIAAKKYGLSDVEIESTHQPGFVTQGGAFLTPEEARLHGEERGQLPESTKDKLTPEDLASERMFMPAPSKEPDALKAPAMRRESDGRIFAAKDAATPHWMMPQEYPELRDRYTLGGVDRYTDGWVTNDGEFLDKKQGHARAIEKKQIDPNFKTEYKGGLSTLDFNEGRNFMPSTVNIGLNTNEGGKVTPEEALAALRKHGIDVNKFAVHQSDSEPTLVADLSRPLSPEEAHQVSLDLKQEAIAQHANGQGELYGPRADKWKPFNPDYFLTHEGKGLSEQPPEASVDAPESRISRPDRSGVSIEPATTKLDSEPFKGKTIEVGEEPWSIRLKELTDKEWNGSQLTDAEENELVDLHKEAVKNYGSYQNWFEKMGGEKDYLGKVFGEEKQKPLSEKLTTISDKNVQFMPSDHPDAIKDAAVRDKESGKIYTGKYHGEIVGQNDLGWNMNKFDYGFVDNSGSFLLTEDAVNRANQLKQLPYEGQHDMSSEDFQSDRRFMPAPHIEREAERLGLRHDGDMEYKGTVIHNYTDPITKSTIAVKQDAERGELQEKLRKTRDLFKGGLSDVSFMPTMHEGFYSPMEKVLEDKLPNRASPEQLSGILAKSPVKKAELEWTGINDLIDQAKKEERQISKQEALDYVRANTPEIKEVQSGGTHDAESWWNDEGGANEEIPWSELRPSEKREATKRYEEEVGSFETKYSQYQIPGGSNYRELLMTLPPKGLPEQFKTIEVNPNHFEVEAPDGRLIAVGETRAGAEERANSRFTAQSARNDIFQDPHWDEPNIVGHLRVNDRTLPDGSKMLMAEEMQSGWGQLGRKEGFDKNVDTAGWTAEEQPSGKYSVYDKDGEHAGYFNAESPEDAISAAAIKEKSRIGVPDMPFKGSGWKKLLLRNLIRHAVEEGYDSIGFTTGEQQAERYDLSNQIGEITWHKDKTPSGYTNQTKIVALTPDQGSVVMDQTIPNDKLSDYVGKEIADKILQDHGKTLDEKYNASGTISGVDLKVGGEGMKGFYDKELVNLANDIGKKFGAKVTKGNISTEKPFTQNHTAALQTLAADPPNRGLRYQIVDKSTGNVLETFDQSVDAWHKGGPDPDRTSQKAQEALSKYGETVTPETKVWKMDITPEMRESVSTHGQPMFMPSTDPWSKIHEHLTEEERASIRDRDKQKIISIFNKLPSIKKGTETALAGQDQRHWYRNSAEAISNTFGPDADRFAALLAALSPQTDVKTNLENAVKVWNNWLKEDRPADRPAIDDILNNSITVNQGKKAMSAYSGNSFRALTEDAPKLSGAKVDSFMRNLRDNVTEVTNDRWMGKYAGLGEHDLGKNDARSRDGMKIKGFNYIALSAHIREVAKALTKRTGESWTPAETQAAIWSYIKAKSDSTPVADVPEFSKLLRDIKPLDNLDKIEDPF